MQIFERQQHASNEKSSLLLGEFLMFRQMIPKITTLHHVYHQVEVLSILKGIVHVNKESKHNQLRNETILTDERADLRISSHSLLNAHSSSQSLEP